MTGCMFSGVLLQYKEENTPVVSGNTLISKVDAKIKMNQEQFYDNTVVQRLPETVSGNQEISVIVTMDTDSVMDAYEKSDKTLTLSEYVSSKEGKKVAEKVNKARKNLVKQLKSMDLDYALGEEYDTILSGFEVIIKAGDFETLAQGFGKQADLMVGNEYEPAEYKVVTNDVDVYDTGIFDSSKSDYQGDGVVVAVLDTGLDYTHTAFSDAQFNTTHEAFTLESVSKKVGQTAAAKFTAGLTGQDVYVSKKVPFAYDYADKDPDVFPINSEHGTHVAGVIAGEDDEITGVAPNAQLAIMKVFSDAQQGAKDSWILAALEDCVALGVDVINMSLGTSCGFTREVDEVKTNEIYDSIRAAGISLICAASNDYNATFSSEKNGNNPVTSNPDSGTVGSPSTYEGSLSVASVDGVKTPYLLFNDNIIYFTEASTLDADVKKDFVDDILSTVGEGVTRKEFDYVTIPGIGRSSDYPHDASYYKGKIVLVKRGTTTFEDKVRVALKEKGASGIIIYNNVSGSISMSVGANVGAVCSITQDEGEKLAAQGEGKIIIDKTQVAGPFMSDFSSWGPTSDLRIKPEITAHGGEILSAVPGQKYDRLSGTSMAAPNQAGATALIRQYVIDVLKKHNNKFGITVGENGEMDPIEVTDVVNELMMSTTDIVYNKNGLPYAVRKQGSGLVNINKATTSASYITTYDRNGELMDKTKFELGDDKERTGVYQMTFNVHNVSGASASYDISSIVMTEGVSPTYTSHGDTTSTQEGYLLNGGTEVLSIENGTKNGNNVTVAGGQTAKITVKVTLTDADKEYIEKSFEYGMYVEGFLTLKATAGTSVSMNVPMLGFYGDWTEAPIFDEEYYDTNKDELDKGLDPEDKLMADAAATKVIGGLYSDYIATLGEYYFEQNPSATPIPASKEHIALTNQRRENQATINSIYSINAGLLRNVKELTISIVEDATGKEIFSKTSYNQYKSHWRGGSVMASSIEVDFGVPEANLENNTRYTVTVETYIDYGAKEDQNNARNVFTFPLYIDFEAPIVTDVQYRMETDKTTKKTKLFADLSIYDNHYAMGVQTGQIVPADPGSEYTFQMNSFGKYVTPVYSSFNSTSLVTIELTDYVSQIKNSASLDKVTGSGVEYNNNSFIATCYDYAMNAATYQLRLPDEILSMYFNVENDTLYLNPNETLNLSEILEIYPGESWMETLDFETSDDSVVGIVNQTLIGKAVDGICSVCATKIANGQDLCESCKAKIPTDPCETCAGKVGEERCEDCKAKYIETKGCPSCGRHMAIDAEKCEVCKAVAVDRTATITAVGKDANGKEIKATLNVVVKGSNNPEFFGGFTLPEVNRFEITGYHVNKAYYSTNPDEREIGFTDGNYDFGTAKTLTMFPSESVDLRYVLDSYFPEETEVSYSVGNEKFATVDENGTIVAQEKGNTFVTIKVTYQGKETFYSDSVSITVKDPFTINAIYLMSYKGLGGTVEVPDDRGITTIYDYAFANSEWVEKDLEAGDVIDEEDPYHIKQAYIGEDTIKKIILPVGVTDINSYAFAGLTALEEIVIPHTLTKIGVGAFMDCVNLNKITYVDEDGNEHPYNMGNIQFINKEAFRITPKVLEKLAEEGKEPTTPGLMEVRMDNVVAIGNYAFQNSNLSYVELSFVAQSIGIGAFADCTKLDSVVFNAPKMKLGSEVFQNCSNLKEITVNAAVIPSYAFTDCKALTNVTLGKDVAVIGEYAFAGTKIASFEVAPDNVAGITTEAGGAILMKGTELVMVAPEYKGQANNTLTTSATSIATGALAGNTKIFKIIANDLTSIGAYAFAGCTNLSEIQMGQITEIGEYAFMNTGLTKTPDLTNISKIGQFAFAGSKIKKVEIADNAKLEQYAFAHCYLLEEVVIGSGVTISEFAFYSPVQLYTLEQIQNTQVLSAFYTEKTYEVKDESGKVQKTYSYYYYDITKGSASRLKSVTIGANSTIDNYAFYGCTRLETLNLEKDEATGLSSTIGNYAFFNAASLKEVDLSGVTKIGDRAFSSSQASAYCLYENTWQMAYERSYIDGKEMLTGYAYSYFAPQLTKIDLTNVTELGVGAFAFNKSLAEIKLSEVLTEIPEESFAMTAIESIELPETVTKVGNYAFYMSALKEVDLTKISEVGEYAFAMTNLAKVDLLEGAKINEGGFAKCEQLVEISNLDKATYIGDYAFTGSKLTELTLTKATYLGAYAFSQSMVEKVVFGNKLLTEVGLNPFYGCAIQTYGREVEAKYESGKETGLTKMEETYDISDSVKVIDGVLYQKVSSGWMLISYPMNKVAESYKVEEDTVKIGAYAFAGATLRDVELPVSLIAIGDKAFYECENLALVIFNSYNAPMLEEAYDQNYLTYDNLPFTGSMQVSADHVAVGLGISKYYMWNITSSFNNFYFGANFVDYIGHIENKLVMVKPANGQNYDSFIFSQYFSTIVDGNNAAMKDTLNVIAMINALPDNITLNDETAVVAARNAYEEIATLEQKALVLNYAELTTAEQTIKYLKQQQPIDPTPGDSSNSSGSDETPDGGCSCVSSSQGAFIVTMMVIMMAVVVIYMRKKEKME